MKILTTRFDEIEVNEEQVIAFPQGIPGFPDEKEFAYLIYQPESPFYLLQSTTNPDLVFLLVNPFEFFNDYEFVLDDQLAEELSLSAKKPPRVLNIVTHKGEIKDMTVNLLAPIIINTLDRVGMQIILDRTEYPTRFKLFPNEISAKQPGKEG